MIKQPIKLILLLLSISLTACSNFPSLTSFTSGTQTTATTQPTNATQPGSGTFVTNTGNVVPVSTVQESNQPLGGGVAQSMDTIDKSKLSHALDSPLGKSTQWSNGNTGINYTVVPTQKVTISGNSLCRRYNATAVKGDKTRQMNGVACISTDGNWHSISAD